MVNARHNNLQAVDLRISHGSFTVITGVSGSGKTSLAFDTIFTEGQRKYVESLSTYARRFLGRLQRPPVDRIDGLKPAVAIDQRSRSQNPRSTVATITEIRDVLRLLYAKIGIPHCPVCGAALNPMSPTAVSLELRDEVGEAGWLITKLAPSDSPDARRAELVQAGWTKLYTDGRDVPLESDKSLCLLEEGAWLVVDSFNPARASRAAYPRRLRMVTSWAAVRYGLWGAAAVRFGGTPGMPFVLITVLSSQKSRRPSISPSTRVMVPALNVKGLARGMPLIPSCYSRTGSAFLGCD